MYPALFESNPIQIQHQILKHFSHSKVYYSSQRRYNNAEITSSVTQGQVQTVVGNKSMCKQLPDIILKGHMRDGKSRLKVCLALPVPLLSTLTSLRYVKCAGSWDYPADPALPSWRFYEMHVYHTPANSTFRNARTKNNP